MKRADAREGERMDGPLQAAVDACWEKAQARWSRFLTLSPPRATGHEGEIAMIDLRTRQVFLNGRKIAEAQLLDCVEALLSHEIGHHVRYPASLVTEARLRLLEKSLIPQEGFSLTNRFEDLLINAQLGADPALREQMIRIYRAFPPGERWEQDPTFPFYLAIYEELWQLDPGALLGACHEPFERKFRYARADAQLMAQHLFHLGPNLFTQFLYFVSVTTRYMRVREATKMVGGMLGCACRDPSPEDWAEALHPGRREREAVERAVAEGWIDSEDGKRLTGAGALDRRVAGLPGQGTADAELVPEVMAAYYRREAERFLLHPPPRQVFGEAVVPTTLDEWEPGEPLASVDWLATLTLRGERLGAVMPLKRERIADYEGLDVPLWQPRVEIYLDVSGSMPDPRRTRNALTLAAQILCVGAIRAGGWVRALLYSGATVDYWTWCRSEVEMSRFLMHYIGGGTSFPFGRLDESVSSCGRSQPTRVVITDRDFDSNFDAAAQVNGPILARAARASSPLVLLLHQPDPSRVAAYRAMGAQVAEVREMEDFPSVAAALAHALFEEGRRAAV